MAADRTYSRVLGGAISERDSQSEERTLNERFFVEAQRIARIGSWAWEGSTRRTRWSDELYQIFGLEPGSVEPSYEAYIERVAPSDQQRVSNRFRQALADGLPCEFDCAVVLPSGEKRIHRATIRVDLDEGGKPVRLFGVAQDITERNWIEEQLLRQEAQLAEAQRIARIGSWEVDVQTRQAVWSDGLHEILGYEAGEVPPSFRAYMHRLPPAERSRVYGLLETAMAEAERFEIEHSLMRCDGTLISVFMQGVIKRDAEGQPLRVLGVSQDITERKTAERQLRLSEERFQLAACATNDVIWDSDLSTNTVWVNKTFSSKGTPRWGAVSREVWTGGIHPEDAARVLDGFRAAVDGHAVVWSDQYRLNAGGEGWRDVLDRGHIVRDEEGKATRIIGAMVDISERRAVERMKDEFISTVSHELRTPLTSIRGALGLLASGRLGTLPEKAQRLLEIASGNTDRLVRLINDILDIERVESGGQPLVKSPSDAAMLARAAVDVVQALADREKIAIMVEAESAPLMADTDQMIQTLTNLLGNAVKFSKAGSTIRLTAAAAGPNVVFSVTDSGRGIPADKLGTIFERFQQVDASDSRDKGGSGLGLAICHSIVRQHGGEIHVESEPGRGSTFTVTVPSGLGVAGVVPVPVVFDGLPA